MAEPLWKPSKTRIEDAQITRFMEEIRRTQGVNVSDYFSLYRWSVEEPAAFWDALWDFSGIIAKSRGQVTLQDGHKMPGARWYPEARLNFAENLLRRRDETDAIVFWGEDRVRRRLSRAELYAAVSRLSQAMGAMGIGPGDRVAAILPNGIEAVIGLLASASLGAIWSSCSPDFGVQGIVDRFGQIEPKLLFATDGYYFNGKPFSVQDRLPQLLKTIPGIEKLVLAPYLGSAPLVENAVLFEDFMAGFVPRAIPFEQLPFDHPLYILYSSGTTGPPKCIVHGAGGALIQHLKEHLLHVDVQPGDRLFYFTTCGWMMWNWLVSGLASGATLLLYDGSPFYPNTNVLFDYLAEEGMHILGVSAKYLDVLRKSALSPKRTHDLASLKTILSTGSPLMPENFDYVYENIKRDVCLSSISGGTDIVSCFVLGTPILPVWRGEIQCRGLGMKVEIFDEKGRSVRGQKGELVCTAPFPSMPVGFWNDPGGKKYRAAYFERFPHVWHHGDYAELTEHEGIIIYGRSDTVLNPGGVRIGTAEIYRQVEQFEEVAESLVIGQEWEGDVRIVLFVKLGEGLLLDEALQYKIEQRIRSQCSPRHVPAKIIQVPDIPRTRSGKIVELAVRNVVHGREVKNTEALANPKALDFFKNLKELED